MITLYNGSWRSRTPTSNGNKRALKRARTPEVRTRHLNNPPRTDSGHSMTPSFVESVGYARRHLEAQWCQLRDIAQELGDFGVCRCYMGWAANEPAPEFTPTSRPWINRQTLCGDRAAEARHRYNGAPSALPSTGGPGTGVPSGRRLYPRLYLVQPQDRSSPLHRAWGE